METVGAAGGVVWRARHVGWGRKLRSTMGSGHIQLHVIVGFEGFAGAGGVVAGDVIDIAEDVR
eukprot:3325542-Prymnesium_polylepis.1